MKRSLLLASPLLLALAACTPGGTDTQSLASHLNNPLYAERYYDDLVEYMVDLVLREDPLTADERTNALIDDIRIDGLRAAQEATRRQGEGAFGQFVSDTSLARGEVLLLDGVLYTGPEFQTIPGPDLHMHLSTVLDPRDSAYPDNSAVDLGAIGSAYGAHTYTLPADVPDNLRTVVLYDHTLERVYGFAQLSRRP